MNNTKELDDKLRTQLDILARYMRLYPQGRVSWADIVLQCSLVIQNYQEWQARGFKI